MCKANFPRSDSLAKHILKVHEKKKLFPCKVCDATFEDGFSLQRHQSCHGVRHCCPICKKPFSQKGNLDAHIRNEHKSQPETENLSSVDLGDENSNKADETNDLLGGSEVPENLSSVDLGDENSNKVDKSAVPK